MSRSGPSPSNPVSKQARSRTHRRVVLNVPLLVGTIVAVAILAPTCYAIHAYQVNRTADAFLERADTLEEEGNLNRAAHYVHRYLRLRPDDLKAQVRLAETYDEAAESPRQKVRAIEIYYEVLGKIAAADGGDISEERQQELRRGLANLALDLGRLSPEHRQSAAREAWDLLQESEGADTEAARILPLAVYQIHRGGTPEFDLWDFVPPKDFAKKPKSLGEVFAKAIDLNPGDIELSTTFARIWRHQPKLLDTDQETLPEASRARQADGLMDAMVAARPEDPEAYLARCAYRTQYDLPGADDDLRTAIRRGSDRLDVLLFAAAQYRREAATTNKAIEFYEKAIALDSTDPRAYLGLGDALLSQAKPDEAVDTWREGIEACGEREAGKVELNLRLADTLITQGDLDKGERVLATLSRTFEQLRPTLPLRMQRAVRNAEDLLRAKLLINRRQHLEAIPLLKSVARSQGSSPTALQAWVLLGDCYAASTQWDQAATAYARAGKIRPDLVRAHRAAAAACSAAGDPSSAIPHLKRALRAEDAPETRLALAQALMQHQISLPKEARKWGEFVRELNLLKKLRSGGSLAEAWRLNLLEAEYTLVRAEEDGQREMGAMDALGLVRQAERDNADSKAFCRAAVMAYEKLGQPEDADRILEKFGELVENETAYLLLKARLLAQRGEIAESNAILSKASKSASGDVMKNLVALNRADIQRAGGQMGKSREELLGLYEKNPNSIWLVQELADRALGVGDLEDLGFVCFL